MKYHRKHHRPLTAIMASISGIFIITTILVTATTASPALAVSDQTCTTTNGITTCTRSANASVTVSASCTLYGGASGTSTSDSSYSGSVNPGATTTINGSKLTTICNDPSGYALYAIGYSGDSYDTPTNTQMIGTNGNISTGTATSGSTSNWAMKVNPVSGSYPTINNSFNSFHVVPEDYTKIATYTSSTASSSSTGAAVQAAYQVYASSTQAAGAYTGKVKYTIVHPNDAAAPVKYMQEATIANCGQTMTDSRDGEEYATALLADGNCWMLDNLRLGGSSTMALTPSDTNITSNWTLPASGTANFTDSTAGYTTAAVNANYKNTTVTSYGSGSGKVGNYYNFCAASAGTYCYAKGSGTGNATHDICPKGWRMPTGDLSGEYKSLGIALGLTWDDDDEIFRGTTYQTALSTPLSGTFFYGDFEDQDSGGNFWSSTRYNGESMSLLRVGSDAVNPVYNNTRYDGNSVRCVMKTPTMQNVGSWGSTLAIGDEVVATDERDGKEYYVAKLPDGNIWMTQNLDHDIVTTAGYYTSSNTDISSAWTPSTATYATGTTTWNGSTTAPQSYNPGDLCWNGTIRNDYDDGTLSNSTVSCTGPNHYHIGNYYNWTAAVAMNNSSSYSSNNTDVNQSICPAGWRLPISGTSNTGTKSFYYLINGRYTSGTSGNIQSSPAYFVYGGYWNGDSYGVGGYGYYWSSVVDFSDFAYALYFDRGGNLYPQDSYGRNGGDSVRCVAR